MSAEFLAAYRALISSPHQVALCARETSLSGLLEKIRAYWMLPRLTDEQVLQALTYCNQIALTQVPSLFDTGWMPRRYHANSQTLSWCIPQGHPEQAFHDQYIERCYQQCLFNQIVSPRTLLRELSFGHTQNSRPAGFIFHLSRCGSTLVSGCLSEISSTSVLSESPVLTEILLDSALTDSEKQQFLLALISRQVYLHPGRNRVVIKWNAWDILLWPLIRSLYPEVPVVLLVRDPLEVLASHQQLAGRHMSGDPSLVSLGGVFNGMHDGEAPLDFRIRVLNELINRMLAVANEQNVTLVDYAQLGKAKITATARLFGLSLTALDMERFCQRMTFHSKAAGLPFKSDGEQKRQVFNVADTEKIRARLLPVYHQLLAGKHHVERELSDA